MADEPPRDKSGFKTRLRRRWRPWLRAIHRDAGYLAIGLTIIYAVSGLAINHVGDWDPDFTVEREEHRVATPIPGGEEPAAAHVVASLQIDEPPAEIYLEGSTLEILFNERERKVVVDVTSGAAVETYKEPRFLLRVSNWLHAARGKKAWNYIADTYAVFLLFLAISGIFMIKGRKGFLGRGAVLVAVGIAVPIFYIHWSGGP
jgi:hypothetical protein